MDLETATINFSSGNLLVLNLLIGFLMLSVALDLHLHDFKHLLRSPLAAAAGFLAQFALLPALTFLLVIWLEPAPGLALGMFLVAACPGGNVSNFFTHFARGDTPLSIGLTALATATCSVLTPLNFALYAGLYEPTAARLAEISLSPADLFRSILILTIIPLILGMSIRRWAPAIAQRIARPAQKLSLAIFGLFILGALAANWANFQKYIGAIAFLVIIQKGAGLLGGYALAWIFRRGEPQRRTIAIESGIQNSGLGLALIFAFFNGYGPMALIAAWWGIWHLISGLALSAVWRRFPPRRTASNGLDSAAPVGPTNASVDGGPPPTPTL